MADATEDAPKVTAFAEAFLRTYNATAQANFGTTLRELETLGQLRLFPLYRRELGLDTAVALMYNNCDFYLFFLEEPGVGFKIGRYVGADEGFDEGWSTRTPYSMRAQQATAHLGLSEQNVLSFVNITPFCLPAYTPETIIWHAEHQGSSFANADGSAAEWQLPELRWKLEVAQVRAEFRKTYESLQAWSSSPQTRGIAFEKLWRDVLGFHGWHPKKITIAGEDDDFTAIRNGAHILGEVRWFAEPMTGGKAREFLAKLDPRPATIGLFISYSGFDEGARAVFRRAVNAKTVVLFDRPAIDEVLNGGDPGSLFDERLREVYDYLFEAPSTS